MNVMNKLFRNNLSDGIHILIVDDNEAIGPMLIKTLDQWGMKATWIKTSDEALEEISVTHFSLVLLDWNLEDNTSLPILIELKKEALLTPVIVMTGMKVDELDLHMEALGNGADSFFMKPLNMTVLKTKILHLIDIYRAANSWFPLRESLDVLSLKQERFLYTKTVFDLLGEKSTETAEALGISRNTLNSILKDSDG